MSDLVQNILYVTKDGCYIHHELEVVRVEQGDETLLKIPIHHLQGITIMSRSTVSPSLLHKCMRRGVFITFLTGHGRFLGRLDSAGSGNVHLRKAQFRASADDSFKLKVARFLVAGKIQNARINLLRSARESEDAVAESALRQAALALEHSLPRTRDASTLNELRGVEGEAARTYFGVFDHGLRQQKDDFHFDRRTRRPPRSRINALLSFFYSMITNDCVAACQSAGLDPYAGFPS